MVTPRVEVGPAQPNKEESTDLAAPRDAALDAAAPRDLDMETCLPDQRNEAGSAWPDPCGERTHTDIEHLRDGEMRLALHALVRNHVALSYRDARQAMYNPTRGGIDVVNGEIECVYTGAQFRPDGTNTPDGMNTEHSWPRSEGAQREPAKSDINHLFPTAETANTKRGSLPFGETDCSIHDTCTWLGGGSMVGAAAGETSEVFMVRPSRRGDVARAHFYFAVRYELPIPDAEERWLRLWNRADPPDARERERASAIESVQNKRNPFVDRPDFVDSIQDF